MTLFKDCNSDPPPFEEELLKHEEPIKILAWCYCGLGNYGVIISDKKKQYHCLQLGGSNYYDQFYSYIAFRTYLFDKPTGLVIDLNPDTIINFKILSLDILLRKKFEKILDDLWRKDIILSNIELYQKFAELY